MRTSYTRISDGAAVSASEAVDACGCLRPGYAPNFSLHLMDGAAPPADRFSLTDAAGKPVQLFDATTGAPATLALNSDVIAAIESEAGKLGLTVQRYLAEVLRYTTAHANLTAKEGASA